jgi:hypothetical protein
VPIAEIADARTRQQAVNIPRALVERPRRRALQNDCLIGGNFDSKVKSPTVRLTDDWKLWSSIHAKASTVDGAVRPNRKDQLAA